MLGSQADACHSLTEQLKSRILETTYNRIRNLAVEEVQGQLVVSGQAPSHHMRQLALKGALELLSADRFSNRITVG
ncbi:MAG TPA: hypothetical protein VGZ22_31580 [Isosphaeraceae bacterium]|nr:hypothetical protein [Isosphaeraceae bacterium]